MSPAHKRSRAGTHSLCLPHPCPICYPPTSATRQYESVTPPTVHPDAARLAAAEARVAALEAALQSTVAMIDAMQADEEPWETPSDLNNARALLAAPRPTATEEP